MRAQHGEVLRQVRRLEAGRLEELGDRRVLAVRRGEHLEHPHAQGVREALEQVGLDLVQRAAGIREHDDSSMD